MVVDVRFLVVVGALVALVAALVGVDERRVVVLVLVVLAAVLELTKHGALVVMGHVVVVVGVHDAGMIVLTRDVVADDALHHGGLLHEEASFVVCDQPPMTAGPHRLQFDRSGCGALSNASQSRCSDWRVERNQLARCQIGMGPLSSATVQPVRRPGLAARPEGIGWVESLVERARAGDVAAFEQLAELTLPDVFRLAAAMVGEDEARDVSQEALIAAWRELPGLRRVERFEAWLRSIVMNRARNALRRRRRHPTVSLIESHAGALVDDSMLATQRRLDLESAFAGTSIEQREVLVLHYVLDLPLREIADVLGLREGTVKSRLHAGLKALRVRLPDR